jgi:hypothetical protein
MLYFLAALKELRRVKADTVTFKTCTVFHIADGTASLLLRVDYTAKRQYQKIQIPEKS